MDVKKKRKKIVPTTNYNLIDLANKYKIPNFRGVFMKDSLPSKAKTNECGIINLNNSNQNGSHWTAYIKKGKYVEYFDSFGNLNCPLELQKYMETDDIWINKDYTQTYNDPPICGYESINWLLNRTFFLFK